MITKYALFTFDGDIFPIAYKLIQEGKEVLVCQIRNASVLGTDTWISNKESFEVRKRRMSLYDGMLNKLSLSRMYEEMRKIENKDECFVIFAHNSLCNIAKEVSAMGFKTGYLPGSGRLRKRAGT